MGANVMRSVIDTNILIYYLAEDIDEKVYANIEQYLQESFQISVISRIELLGWQQGGDEWLTIAEKFLSSAVIFPLTNEIADKTIAIRKKHSIKLPDAVIAATCLVHDSILITRNTRDFKSIQELTVLNPIDIE